MKRPDPHWIVPAAANLLLIWMTGEANHWLAPAGASLFTAGLLVAFPALRLRQRHGFLVTGLTSLALAAHTPLAEIQVLAGMLLAHALLVFVRGRFPREDPAIGLLVALGVNALLFMALSLSQPASTAGSAAVVRLVSDLLWSQAAVGLAGVWFFALQYRGLRLCGIDLDAEQREAV